MDDKQDEDVATYPGAGDSRLCHGLERQRGLDTYIAYLIDKMPYLILKSKEILATRFSSKRICMEETKLVRLGKRRRHQMVLSD